MIDDRLSRRTLLSGAIGAAGLLAMPAIVRAQAPTVMKIGTSTINDLQHAWMKHFAAAIEAKAAGSIKVELYPASQLGAAPRMIESTQFGTIQAFVGPPEFLSGVDSRFAVLGAPGLFKDLDHADRVLQAPVVREAVNGLGAAKGLRGAGLFLYGPACFDFRTPAASIADLAGRKVRVFASAMQTEPLKALGATAVPMPLSEVLPALQQGTIDGVMSVLPVFAALRFYDAAKYIVETNHAAVTVVSVVSTIWYEGLTADQQAAVDAAGAETDKAIYAEAVATLAKARETWTSNGGAFASLPAEEQAELVALLKPIGERVTAAKPGERALFELLSTTAAKV